MPTGAEDRIASQVMELSIVTGNANEKLFLGFQGDERNLLADQSV